MIKEHTKFDLKEYNEFKEYQPLVIEYDDGTVLDSDDFRSEERRVGKECVA